MFSNKEVNFLGTRRITNKMCAMNYHVVDSLEEWLSKECVAVETVFLDEPQVPRFKFNIKVHVDRITKRRELYIPGCAIDGLKRIKDYLKTNKIGFKPRGHIKYAFECRESKHCYKLTELTKSEHIYPAPVDGHIARAVAMQLFDPQDSLAAEAADQNEDTLVYYYLSVLEGIEHPVIKHALDKFNASSENVLLYDSALVPKCERPNSKVTFYSLYVDLIYFLGLLAPPICVGDTASVVREKLRARHQLQAQILCDTIGITAPEQPMLRGEGWQKLITFLDSNPSLCHALAEAVLKPPELDRPLTVIELQVIRQAEQLWQWTGLYDFRNCYHFASQHQRTAAHSIPVIEQQCSLVVGLYGKLKKAVGEEHLIPYAKLLVRDNEFFKQFDAQHYPHLFYATMSKTTFHKTGNSVWQHFVATRPADLPRDEIDRKLDIPWKEVETESQPQAAALEQQLVHDMTGLNVQMGETDVATQVEEKLDFEYIASEESTKKDEGTSLPAVEVTEEAGISVDGGADQYQDNSSPICVRTDHFSKDCKAGGSGNKPLREVAIPEIKFEDFELIL